jgi:hypothetical protein
MSHVAKIELEIKDLTALAAACQALGLEFMYGQKTYKCYGRIQGMSDQMPAGFTVEEMGHCEHAIRIPGNSRAYEIGVVTRRDGKAGYALLLDAWQGGFGLTEKIGESGQKLKQNYSSAVARAHMIRHGYRVISSTKQDGTIVLRASR